MTREQADALFAELSEITGLSDQQWRDVLAQQPDDVAQTIADWRTLGNMSWSVQTTTMARVLAILNIIAAIANPVSAIAGGVSGVGAAIATLKAI